MIKFLVDSGADRLPSDPSINYFVPINISIDGKEYKSGINLSSDEFYSLQASAEEFPKTSQPSPQDFLEIFEKVRDDGDELICFIVSSALSGTYQGAVMAKELSGYDKIHIVDTLTATHLIGILVDYAARLRDEGATAEEIAEKCDALKGKVKVLAGIDTLEYLYKGGRMSRTTATVGSLVNIKPILTVTTSGKVEAIAKAIGKGKAIQTLLDKFEVNDIDERFPIYSIYSSGTENCEALEEKLSERGFAAEKRVQIGPAIGAHTGPGIFGLIFVTK